MSWNRNVSSLEQLMIDVLLEEKEPLTINEIVENIINRSPNSLTGKTPNKSLYSIIYRREKRRIEKGEALLFQASKRGGAIYYSVFIDELFLERDLEK
ncbi:MAG: hypothetical protein HRU20_07740 [Pseudomonadales bacterium]|nr:hypothetical protein [Pseudomonadales bacterium]